MQDIDSIAHIRFSCAQIRLARGDHERGEIQEIFEELAEAFTLSLKLDHPDGIGATGYLLGQFLLAGGQLDEAIKVLETAAAAFDKIERSEQAAQCRTLIDQKQGEKS
jgi:hypothetical protein